MMLLDTCALIWWMLDPDKLSLKARRKCDSIFKNSAFLQVLNLTGDTQMLPIESSWLRPK